MQLERFDQITPEFLVEYRVKVLDLSLEKFWGAVGCSAPRGLRYENGKYEIPEAVKRLVFLQYGVGIPTDCEGEDFQNFLEALRNGRTLTLSKLLGVLGQTNDLLGQASALLTEENAV